MANLIEAYRESITGLAWMGEETKHEALKKLDSFRAKIGYPDKWIDYSAVEIDPADLLGNVERAHSADVDRHLDEVGKPVDRDKWLMTPQTVNAYYHPLLNEIVFPAAILQPPFFTADADDAVNYGGIGAVIGHEIGHGFDDQGSQYDGSGLLRNWWTEDDRTAFEALTSKLVAQFEALSPTAAPGHNVNGKLTLGENIGDLGGLTIAYKAYLISLDGQEPPVLDGLTGVQRFFASWAAGWRQVIRTEEAIRRLATDPHSPNEFRTNAIAKNLDAFHEAFGDGGAGRHVDARDGARQHLVGEPAGQLAGNQRLNETGRPRGVLPGAGPLLSANTLSAGDQRRVGLLAHDIAGGLVDDVIGQVHRGSAAWGAALGAARRAAAHVDLDADDAGAGSTCFAGIPSRAATSAATSAKPVAVVDRGGRHGRGGELADLGEAAAGEDLHDFLGPRRSAGAVRHGDGLQRLVVCGGCLAGRRRGAGTRRRARGR